MTNLIYCYDFTAKKKNLITFTAQFKKLTS